MAVTYMRKLEEEPGTYDSKFTTLTKGVNLKVHEWILDRVNGSESVLEIGCGTGNLAKKMALKGSDVVAIDINYNMINYAMQNYPSESDVKLLYQVGSFSDFPVEDNSKDTIVSTFMLSELGPLEQQIFLRNAWKALKADGRLILAAEFIPSGISKQIFKLKRWWYKKKLRRLRLKSTHLIKWFFNYLEPIGYEILSQKDWKHGSIKVLELKKVFNDGSDEPGYYRPKPKEFKGLGSQLRIYRNLLTGQIDNVPIEPGIYQSGHPNKDSPVIVTANYDYTFIKVMRDLKGIDAWVLCIDSRGINVWCAARGDDFGNRQLLEAVEATGIQNYTNKRILILPQLAAGGVAIPQLPKKSEKFPFKVKYGPVWSKQLPDYLRDQPARKPDKMKLAKFSLSHRIRAGISHTTFSFRKIYLLPLLGLLVLLFVLNLALNLDWHTNLWWVGEFALWILLTNVLISLLFPLSNFTRCFIIKGIFFALLNGVILGTLTWFLHGSIWFLLLNLPFFLWIAFFSTMSFSGYTMSSAPSEIQGIYPKFIIINSVLLIASIILSTIGLVLLYLI